MASLYKKPVVRTDRKTGDKIRTKSRKWWGRYRNAAGVERRVALATDKAAAQQMLAELVRKVERQKAGLDDPTEEQRKRPIKDHLADFKRYLQNKEVTKKQVHSATTQVQCMIIANQWKAAGDISASGALEFLGGLRNAGKSAQTFNHYLKSAKQFTRWLVRDRRALGDPLTHLSKLNVSTDRRHDRRALCPDEFALLVDAAQNGSVIESISGPDRAMMYVLAAWTGFRKGEIGSLTRRSFRLDDDPATATVAACYRKRKRQDTQILHPQVARRLNEWMATKTDLDDDGLLFPVSGRAPGGKERKTHKMMKRDLETARAKWISRSQSPEEQVRRKKTDFLCYESEDGLFADFHSNRHLFITSLERAGLSPKMAQTLARHSDVRLTLGVYTHVGLHDQTAAIQSLPAPPGIGIGPRDEDAALRATGTDGRNGQAPTQKIAPREVPTVVPRGAQNGAVRLASRTSRTARDCTQDAEDDEEQGRSRIATSLREIGASCTESSVSAPNCIDQNAPISALSPRGFEPLTFGSGERSPESSSWPKNHGFSAL
ncbi:MAG: tyrosine-type recombinase/integrase [Planctomycetaceae bacterium]